MQDTKSDRTPRIPYWRYALVLLIVSAIAFAGGYYSGISRLSRISEIMTANMVLDLTMQAKHDAGLVELIDQKKYDGARELSLARYYSRVLLVESIANKSASDALREQAQMTVDRAKDFWKRNPYTFEDARDNEKILRLLTDAEE